MKKVKRLKNPKLDEEELKLKFLYEDLRRKRLETGSRLLFQSTLVISILFTIIFSSLLLVNPNDRKDLLLFPLTSKKTDLDSKTIKELNDQIAILQNSLNNMQVELSTLKDFSSDNRDITQVKTELNDVTIQLDNLNETILEKPDTAITSKLIREKQNLTDQKVENIIKDYQRLEDKVDNFLSNLIAVPIFAALAGLIFTIIAAITTPFLTKLKDRIWGNQEKDLEEIL